jgi:hypothetical protein
MVDSHEWIEELLAGYVLRSLSGEDAVVADRLLSEHVPVCPICRDTLAAFQGVAGEMGLATTPVKPPDLLLPRMHDSLADAPLRRRRPVSIWAVAASFVAVLGLAGWNVTLGLRANDAEHRATTLANAVDVATRSDSSQVFLHPSSSTTSSPMQEVSAPGVEEIYFLGHGIPDPAPGHVYRIWFGRGGRFVPRGTFVPDGGTVEFEVRINPNLYDEIVITEDMAGSIPTQPSAASHRWEATLTTG